MVHHATGSGAGVSTRLFDAARRAGLPLPENPADPQQVGDLGAALYLHVERTRRPAREEAYLESATRFTLVSPVGALAAWSWGPDGAPLVVLVHGWEGRGSQLGAFVPALVAAGFRVVAFDGPAHGDSPGEHCHLPLMAGIVASLPAQLGEVRAVVGHSFGAASAALAAAEGPAPHGAVFLAPPLWHRGRVELTAERMELPAAARAAFFEGIERRTGHPVDWADMRNVARVAPCPLLVFHDPADADTDYAGSVELVAQWRGARLVPCPGRGHLRILTTPAVVEQTVRFIASLR